MPVDNIDGVVQVRGPQEKKQALTPPQRKQYTEYREESARRRERNDEEKFWRKGKIDLSPPWRDSLAEKMYAEASNNPNMPDTLALAFFAADRGGNFEQSAGERFYSDAAGLSAYVNKSTGQLDRDLLERDQFVLSMEKAFYKNDGSIPLSWFVQNAADMDLFTGLQADRIEALYRHGKIRAEREFVEAEQEAAFKRADEAIISGYITQTPSQLEGAKDEFVERYVDKEGIERWTTDVGIGARYLGGHALGFFENYIRPAFSSAEEAVVDQTQQVGPGLRYTAEYFGAGRQNNPFDVGQDLAARNADQRDAVHASLGMSPTEFTLQAGLGDALGFAKTEMPTLYPEEYRAFVEMAGGDTDLAVDMIVDTILFSEENKANMAKQQEMYNAELDIQLQKLEDENFTFTDGVLDILGSYGNFVETLAVGATVAAVALLDDDSETTFWDEQYLQSVNDFDTPASVLGLEGTLVGLLFNITLNTAMDPLNFVFSPALKAGVSSIDDVIMTVARSTTKTKVRQLAGAVGSRYDDGISVQSMIDVLMATGKDAEALALQKGFFNPVVGVRSTKLANVSSDIHISFLDDILPAPLLDETLEGKLAYQEAVERAGKRLKAGEIDPIEITFNPDTGAAKVTKGAEDVAYFRSQDFDSIPMTFKIDEGFAVVHSKKLVNFADEEAEFIHAVADGSNAKALRGNSKVSGKSNEITQRSLLESATTEHVANPGIHAGTTKNGQQVFRNENVEKGWVQYYIVDDSGQAVAAVSGQPGHVMDAEGLFMATSGQGRRTMGDLFDIASTHGDELILQTGKGPSISEDAIKFTERYAKGIVDDPKHAAVNIEVAEGVKTFDWGLGTSLDNPSIKDIGEGVLHVRPRAVLTDDLANGPVDMDKYMAMYKQHLLDGGDPLNANKTALATQIGKAAGDMFRGGKLGKVGTWIDNMITPINANANFAWLGSLGRNNFNQMGARIFSAVGDYKGWEPFQSRLLQFYQKQGFLRHRIDSLTAEGQILLSQKEELAARMGDYMDGGTGKLKTTLTKAERAEQKKITAMQKDLTRQVEALRDQQRIVDATANDFAEGNQIMDDMMEEYNKKYIATRQDWIDTGLVNKETGMVDWEHIKVRKPTKVSRDARIVARAKEDGITLQEAAKLENSGVIPASINEMIGVQEATGQSMEQFVNTVHDLLQHKGSWLAPASPIEIMAAASGGPNAVKSVTARLSNVDFAEGVHKAHTFWVLDKVLTPRTGITVSMDELISGFHAGGTSSVFRYAEDKAIKVADHITSIRGTPVWNKLPSRWKDRLVTLEEYPIYLRQQERAFLEMSGIGFDEIKFGKGLKNNDKYYEAAQRTTQGWIGDPGFQAYLLGDDALDAWLAADTTAAKLRDMEFLDAATGKVRTGMTPEQAKESYGMIETWMTSNLKAKDRAKAMAEIKAAAVRAAEKGGTAAGPTQLPDWVLEGYGTVTGNVDVAGPVSTLVNKFSDNIFQKPLNYRRGWEASMVRKFEQARLDKLYASQGRRVISENEMRSLLRKAYPGYTDDMLTAGIGKLSADLMAKEGVISQRFVDELIEQKVIHELEGRMYSFTMESRAGRKVAALAPFGKPYADMVGRWTRDLTARPQLRGYINNTNFFNMGKIANKVVDQLPFNPKTAGFLSRVANTDFDLDRIDEDPLVGPVARGVGLEKVDLSAGLFLPHEGDNPLNVLIPGLGMVPVGLLHLAFNWAAPDPVEEPLLYEKFVEQWSQLVPSLGFSKPQGMMQQGLNLYAGGGTGAKMAAAGDAIQAVFTGESHGASTFQQSWKPKIAADRQVKLILTSEDFLEQLADLPDDLMEEGLSALLDEELDKITREATQAQGAAALKEIATEIYRPVRATFDSTNDNLNEVWIDSVGMMELELPSYYDASTPDGEKQAADWARNQFFDLPDWKRDALVAENPGLAVNLVSMWEWTDAGKNAAISENNLPYRTGGSTSDSATHDAYLNLGYIQPLGPKALAVNIIGTMLTAKERTAKAAYTEAAATINNERWDAMSEAQKIWFQESADELRADGHLPYRTGKELWNNYGDFKRVADELFPPDPDDPDDTGFSIPTKLRAWGVEMPGSREDLREDFDKGYWTIREVTPKLAKLAAALGIDWDEDDPDGTIGMDDVYVATADSIARNRLDNPIFAHIDAGYRNWLAPRSAGQQAFTANFGRILDGKEFTPETRALYKKNQTYIGEALDRRGAGDPSWRTIRDQAVEQFSRMIQDDAFRGTPAARLWDDAYGRQLGSLDWTPDEPAPLMSPDGEANPNASQVFVRSVVDGDTIDVSFGDRSTYRVRLLGWNAQELGQGGEGERDDLEDAIEDAIDRGLPVAIVRDPERYSNTDLYGRVFGWLYIGEEPWYNADTMIPRRN